MKQKSNPRPGKFDPDIPNEVLTLVPDYRVNILVPADTDPDLFKTDFRQIVKVARAGTDKEKLNTLLKKDPAFQTIDEDAAAVIWAMAGRKVPFTKKNRKEKVDMLKGFQDWIDYERADAVMGAKAEVREANRAKAEAEANADKANRAKAEAEANADKANRAKAEAEANADKANREQERNIDAFISYFQKQDPSLSKEAARQQVEAILSAADKGTADAS